MRNTGDGLLGCGGDEVRVSRVWGGEGKGELAVLLVKFAWTRESVKTRLPDHQDHPDQQK